MKNYSRGFTVIEILMVLVIVGLIVSIAVPVFLKEHLNKRCQQFISQIQAAKETVAARDNLHMNDTVTVEQLAPLIGHPFDIDEQGRILCPHGKPITIVSVSLRPFPSCISGDYDCAALRDKIKRAKSFIAAVDNLRWRDSVPIKELQRLSLVQDLVFNVSGETICPQGGVISINGVGSPPTCSLHHE